MGLIIGFLIFLGFPIKVLGIKTKCKWQNLPISSLKFLFFLDFYFAFFSPTNFFFRLHRSPSSLPIPFFLVIIIDSLLLLLVLFSSALHLCKSPMAWSRSRGSRKKSASWVNKANLQGKCEND